MLKRFMMNLNLKPRLIIYFALMSVIPVLLIGSFTYALCAQVIMGMARDSATETIELVSADIERLFNDADSLCNLVSGDINMQENIRRKFLSIQEQYSTDLRGSMELAYVSTYKEDIFGLYVLGENGGKYKSNAASFRVEDLRQTAWYRKIIESDGPVWFAPHEWSFAVKTVNDRYISVGIPFVDKASGEKGGVVLADIEERTLTNLIGKGLPQGSLFLLDGKGDIISLPAREQRQTAADETEAARRRVSDYLALENPAKVGSMLVPDEEYLIVCRPMEQTDWTIVGLVEKSVITKGNDAIAMTVATVLLLVVIGSVMAAVYISETMTRPLRRLTELMAQVEEGDLSVQMQTRYRDEIGRLGKNFNNMLAKMRTLIQQIYDDQHKLRKSELKALQSQITPHFLYNSLDSITWLLRLGKVEEAQKMLTALTQLFMVALSKGREVIPIEDELKHVTSYLVIESMIYSKKFSYTVEADPETLQYKTLKLLLQPLVENSIYHGIKPSETKEQIAVTVRSQGDELLLCVRDTGIGMPREKLETLRRELEQADGGEPAKSGYGIRNVHERIKVFYGPQYGLQINSEYGVGTEITIRIPKIKGDEPVV